MTVKYPYAISTDSAIVVTSFSAGIIATFSTFCLPTAIQNQIVYLTEATRNIFIVHWMNFFPMTWDGSQNGRKRSWFANKFRSFHQSTSSLTSPTAASKFSSMHNKQTSLRWQAATPYSQLGWMLPFQNYRHGRKIDHAARNIWLPTLVNGNGYYKSRGCPHTLGLAVRVQALSAGIEIAR